MAIRFVQARHYTPASDRPIDLLVIHTMEAAETHKTAESVAAWFAGPSAPQASAHYCIDDDSIVQCVKDKDVAWHAPGVNHNGIGLEHAGFASQTGRQWDDLYSRRMLDRSAVLAGDLCVTHKIPVDYVPAAGLAAGKRGITTHLQATLAFSGGHGHTDPGQNFPMADYLASVKLAAGGPVAGPPVKQPEPVLHEGSKGWRVKQAQRLLNAAHEHADVDGVFGPETTRSVKHFQTRAGLQPDGVIGPATWAALWHFRYLGTFR